MTKNHKDRRVKQQNNKATVLIKVSEQPHKSSGLSVLCAELSSLRFAGDYALEFGLWYMDSNRKGGCFLKRRNNSNFVLHQDWKNASAQK